MKRHTFRSLLSMLAGVLLALSLGIGALGGTLWLFGTGAPLLERWLAWDNAPASAGLTEDDLAPIAHLVADTMAGRTQTFQYKGLFSEQAQRHMLDCAPLFRLARTVGLVGFGLFLASLGGCLLLRDGRRSAVGILIGVGVLFAALLALAVWGLVNFDSLFTAFHRVLFTNDEWIFAPDDLLILLMPIGFFTRCAITGGIAWAACLAALAGVAALVIRKKKNAEQKTQRQSAD